MSDAPPDNFGTQASFDNMIDTGNDQDTTPAMEESGVSSQTALTVYSDAPVFDRSEIVMPRLRLAQGLTSEVQDGTAHPGEWLLTGEEPVTTLTFIPLRMTRRRELRGEGDERNTVFCASMDGVLGVGDPGGQCAKCPMAEWTNPGPGRNGQKQKSQAPLCTFMYSYLGYSVQHGQVVLLEMSKTGIRPAKLLNTIIMQRGMGKFGVELSSVITKDGSKTYAVPIIKQVKVEQATLVEARQALLA